MHAPVCQLSRHSWGGTVTQLSTHSWPSDGLCTRKRWGVSRDSETGFKRCGRLGRMWINLQHLQHLQHLHSQGIHNAPLFTDNKKTKHSRLIPRLLLVFITLSRSHSPRQNFGREPRNTLHTLRACWPRNSLLARSSRPPRPTYACARCFRYYKESIHTTNKIQHWNLTFLWDICLGSGGQSL